MRAVEQIMQVLGRVGVHVSLILVLWSNISPAFSYWAAKENMPLGERQDMARRYLEVWQYNCRDVPPLSLGQKEYLAKYYDADPRTIGSEKYFEAINSTALAIRKSQWRCDNLIDQLTSILLPSTNENVEYVAWGWVAYLLGDPQLLQPFEKLKDERIVDGVDCDNENNNSFTLCTAVFGWQENYIVRYFLLPRLEQ